MARVDAGTSLRRVSAAMIISHEHRYVFVEVPRTGSSAINRELRERYGGVRILTKPATYEEFARQASDDERATSSSPGSATRWMTW